jgi:signal peptidase II
VKINKYIVLASIAGLIVLADQIVKTVIAGKLPLYQSVTIIPGLFNITHIRNPGGAFGFLAGNSTQLRFILFVCTSIAAIGLIGYFYVKLPPGYTWMNIGLALICGGAIGNLIDRLRFKEVVDFLDFYLGSLHWPAFNIADSAITVGIFIFIYHILFNKLPA